MKLREAMAYLAPAYVVTGTLMVVLWWGHRVPDTVHLVIG
jgi:hypothetical protein